jgi:hypothetical protein
MPAAPNPPSSSLCASVSGMTDAPTTTKPLSAVRPSLPLVDTPWSAQGDRAGGLVAETLIGQRSTGAQKDGCLMWTRRVGRSPGDNIDAVSAWQTPWQRLVCEPGQQRRPAGSLKTAVCQLPGLLAMLSGIGRGGAAAMKTCARQSSAAAQQATVACIFMPCAPEMCTASSRMPPWSG